MPTVKDLQPVFWKGFNTYVKMKGILPNSSEFERDEQWHTINLGISGVHIEVVSNQKGNRVELYFNDLGHKNKDLFTRLAALCKERSIAELDPEICWELMPDNDLSKVVLYRKAGNIKETETWPEQYEWLSTKALEMQNFFLDDLKKLTSNA